VDQQAGIRRVWTRNCAPKVFLKIY
jgi:hypothetical protein